MIECTYRLSVVNENVWECSHCNVVWVFPESGPKENKMYYCPGCGAKIIQLERTEWDAEKDESVIKRESYGKD